MLLKAFCVALSLSLLAATVMSSASNTAENSLNENVQSVSILESGRLGCGHHYFAIFFKWLLGSSSKSPSYNGTLPRFPKDISLKILSYLAPVKLSDPAQVQIALNSLYRFEKLYGLNRYVDEITVEQIHALESMELELRPFLEQDSDMCHSLLISRKHVLRSLGFSLSLKLKGPSTPAMLRTLPEFIALFSDIYAIQTAINMFFEPISERFIQDCFYYSKLSQDLWKLVTNYCFDVGVIRRFAQILPESVTENSYCPFMVAVPFFSFSNYRWCVMGKDKPRDAELRAMSNLLDYCPMIKSNDCRLQLQYFNQYQELINRCPFYNVRTQLLEVIISIKHGSYNDIINIRLNMMDNAFRDFGVLTVPLFWNRSDFNSVQQGLQLKRFSWHPCGDLVIDPVRFFNSIIDGQIVFPPTDLLWYSLHKVPNTNGKAQFEAELFGFVHAIDNGQKDLAHSVQLEWLVYAMDHAYRINQDNVVRLACSVIREQRLSRDEVFLKRMAEISNFFPKLWDGPFKHLYCTLFLPGPYPIEPDWRFSNLRQFINVLILTADFETLKLMIASENGNGSVKDLALSMFLSNLERNVVLPKHIPQFFNVFGYTPNDLSSALRMLSTDIRLFELLQTHCPLSYMPNEFPSLHSLWYYFWMEHQEAAPNLVKFYERHYGCRAESYESVSNKSP